MFHIALFEPQIPQNTGNIIRLCANNGCHLHLIEPYGFKIDEKKVRRAGLDYHDLAKISHHKNYAEFAAAMAGKRIFALTTHGSRPHTEPQYQAGDVLLFGAETHGLTPEIRNSFDPDFRIRIPMMSNARSLNLSNAVAIVSYEAWRQINFEGL